MWPYVTGVVVGCVVWWFLVRPWQKRNYEREMRQR